VGNFGAETVLSNDLRFGLSEEHSVTLSDKLGHNKVGARPTAEKTGHGN